MVHQLERKIKSTSKRKVYNPDNSVKPDGRVHYGQRKLLMTEIEFLTNTYDKYKNYKDIIFLYTGAACGLHLRILFRMFPNFTYHLYDKNDFVDFSRINNVKIEIFKEYFTNELAHKYKDKNVLFVSDIRDPTLRSSFSESNVYDNKIANDMVMQMEWYQIMKPISALLKFRLPWTTPTTTYLDGTIYYQVWQPPNSAETRLIPNGKIKTYDNKEYEEILHYFNTETRTKSYEHDFPCHPNDSYDTNAELLILCNYMKRFSKIKKSQHKEYVCKLVNKINHVLPFK
jgi:cap2 methyltransferase